MTPTPWRRASARQILSGGILASSFKLVAAGAWARDAMSKTVINRRALVTITFLFASQALLMLTAPRIGLTVVQSLQLMTFLWFVFCSMVVICIDRRLIVAAIGHGVAFVLGVAIPTSLYYLMTAANFLFLVNAAWHWRPTRPRSTFEEIVRDQPLPHDEPVPSTRG
jgi:hypothetical protein